MSIKPARADLTPDLVAGYRPQPGVYDEMLDAKGRLRPAWRSFIPQLAALGPEEISQRFARGDQYLRDLGMSLRQHAEGRSFERAWPLAHVPVLLDESEWQALGAGLRQRAELLEALLADLVGPNRMEAAGHLPAGLIARSPAWLRPLVGITPRGGHHLHFIAFDLGRGPDGNWRVLADRTQAPAGAGFALENRVATARIYADLFPEAHVHRLAGFLRSFRDALQGLNGGPADEVAILTPGSLNETYFEHAHLARYLGYSLLESADLSVEDGRLMVRTIAGSRPMTVLWRRMDATDAPLSGLIDAVRQGSVTLVNALGAGVLEMPALMAFLPRIAPELIGAPLMLPNIATWWCGDEAGHAHVLAHRDQLTIGPALSAGPALPPDDATLPARVTAGDPDLIGQEVIPLSTTPVHERGRLLPRPLSLRVFLARTPEGWQIMPGGFARIARSEDAGTVAMRHGGSSADVWVVSAAPIGDVPVQRMDGAAFARLKPGVLPSRAAENLFRLGRHVERAESLMRLVRAHHLRIAETAEAQSPLIRHFGRHLATFGIDSGETLPGALLRALEAAVSIAGHVRDRFSPDAWTVLNDLATLAEGMRGSIAHGDETARAMGALLRRINGFSGLVHENMYRSTGWRFLSIGRALERAIALSGTLAALVGPDAPEGALDLAVEIGDSVMSHRRRYAVGTTRETMLDLLVLDTMNPRAILSQLTELRDHISFLPGAEPHAPMTDLGRAVLQAHTGLAVQTPERIDDLTLLALQSRMEALSERIAEAYFR